MLVGLSDEEESGALGALLGAAQLRVEYVHRGSEALRICSASSQPALLLLDDDLPDVAGTEICRRLRQTAWTRLIPVVLFSHRREDIDRVVAFELGADDYITKPYDPREVILRIRAILRRCYPGQVRASELLAGPLRLDRDAHRVWLASKPLSLTRVEFALLEVLMMRRGRAQPRARLLEDVWGRDADGNLRTVDTHVRRLREKLGPASSYIHTVRGVGYRFGSGAGVED